MPAQAQAGPAAASASYEDLVPGSLAWIAATHGGGRPDPIARAEAALDRPERLPETEDPKAQKAARRETARQERAERRAAAKAAKQRAREEQARAKQEAAAERERERVWAEEARRLEAEQAEQAKAEALERERASAETTRRAAQEKARRRAESKAAARAALATPPGTHRAEPATERTDREESSPEDTALLEAVGASETSPPPAEDVPDGRRTDAPDDGGADEPEVAQAAPTDADADDDTATVVVPAVAAVEQDGEREEPATERREPATERQEPAPSRRSTPRRGEARRAEKVERRRAKAAAVAAARHEDDDVPEPPSVPQEKGSSVRRTIGLVGVALGVVGLLASVTLALAALLVAFGFDPATGVLASVASVADPLTQPLRGLATFTGENAAAKESFVAYGAGSLVYLAVGFAVPKLFGRGSGA